MTAYLSRTATVPASPSAPASDAALTPGCGFTIKIGRRLATVVVALRGTLDALAATRLAAALGDLIDGQGNLAVAVDLGDVERVAPSGLQVLSAAAASLERRGGTLSLEGPGAIVLSALDAAGLTSLAGSDVYRSAVGDPGGPALTWSPSARPGLGRPRAGHPAGRGRQEHGGGGRR